MRSTLCRIKLELWILTIGIAGWFIVQGWTTQGIDGRMDIVLAPAEAARSAGIEMIADVNPGLMAKLPLKQMGMSIHQDMDALADAIARKETPQSILKRLSSMTVRCTTCHDLYRFSTVRQTSRVSRLSPL